VYQESDDYIRRRRSGYRSLDDTPAVREWHKAEEARKAARKARRVAAAASTSRPLDLKVPCT
jgi:hypothetical protein